MVMLNRVNCIQEDKFYMFLFICIIKINFKDNEQENGDRRREESRKVIGIYYIYISENIFNFINYIIKMLIKFFFKEFMLVCFFYKIMFICIFLE